MSIKQGETVINLKNVSKRFLMETNAAEGRAENQAENKQKGFFFRRNEKTEKLKPAKYFYAVNAISLSVKKGECVLAAGANGSGKTVLMMIIAGLIKPSSGSVRVAENCGLIFQDADLQILGETPEEDIMLGLKNLKLSAQETERRLNDALEKTGLQTKRYFLSRFLSGGEKRRLSVAGILAMGFPVIIFDEPYANLDYSGIVQVNALIQMLKKDGHTVLLLTHELEKCSALADRLIVLNEGKKVFDGNVDEGLRQNLKKWNIRHPLCSYTSKEDLLWK